MPDDFISMSQLDRLLHLPKGTASRYRKIGLFEAQGIGRGVFVRSSQLDDIREAVQTLRNPGPIWDDDEWISVAEAAKRLKLKLSSVYNQVRNGRIVGRKDGHRLLLSAPSVEHYRITRPAGGVSLDNQRRLKGIVRQRLAMREAKRPITDVVL